MSQAELRTGPAFPPRAGQSPVSDRVDAWSGDVPVEEFIDAHRFSRFQWTLMGVCFLIVLIDGMDTAAIGDIAPALAKGWGIAKGALAPVLIFVVGQAIGSIGLVSALIFLAGTTMNGAQSSMPALAAMFYPTQSRATGVSWMYGVGRFGGIAGVALSGLFAQWKLGLPAVFALLAVPSVIAGIALFVKLRAHPEQERA